MLMQLLLLLLQLPPMLKYAVATDDYLAVSVRNFFKLSVTECIFTDGRTDATATG